MFISLQNFETISDGVFVSHSLLQLKLSICNRAVQYISFISQIIDLILHYLKVSSIFEGPIYYHSCLFVDQLHFLLVKWFCMAFEQLKY